MSYICWSSKIDLRPKLDGENTCRYGKAYLHETTVKCLPLHGILKWYLKNSIYINAMRRISLTVCAVCYS